MTTFFNSCQKQQQKNFMHEEIASILKEHGYEFKNYINKGAFGFCYLVRSNKYGIDFVCKCTFNCQSNQSFITSYEREVKALLNLNHPHIVRVYDIFTEGNFLFLIMEYCSGGSMQSMIEQKKVDPKSHSSLQILHQVINAINYMHERGFAHCDIKPSNILIDEFGRAKLADFGLTHFVGSAGQDNETNYGGSFSFMAPELLKYKKCDPFKSDVWALGVTLYYFFTRHLPFKGKSMEQMLCQIQAGPFPVKGCPKYMTQIIEGCLRYSASKRLTITQIKSIVMTNASSQSSPPIKSMHKMLMRGTYQNIMNPYRLQRNANSSSY